jgi:predicted 3-demethylubiquinone-9 3-methyltransferase (glyoxalase superfamily)
MYGLSWQVVPTLFFELLSDPDPVTSQAVEAAMLEMNKFVSAVRQEAYDNA